MGLGKKIGIGVGLGILGFFIFVYVGGTILIQEQEEQEEQELRNMSIGELKELSVSWNYGDLLRNPEKYKGKIIEFDGEIFIVYSPGKDHYQFLIWHISSAESILDQLIVDWKGGRLLSGDEIRGFGMFEGVVDVGSMFVENYYNPKPYVTGIHLVCTSC